VRSLSTDQLSKKSSIISRWSEVLSGYTKKEREGGKEKEREITKNNEEQLTLTTAVAKENVSK
jgi:hypothetical protein